VERAHQPFIDRGPIEHEGVDILGDRQLGGRHPIADRSSVPVCCLGPQQISQDLHQGALALQAGSDRLVERAGHALETKAAHGLDHLMPLHLYLAGCHSGHSWRPVDAPAPDPRP